MKSKYALFMIATSFTVLVLAAIAVFTTSFANTRLVAAALADAPLLSSPANGATISEFGPFLLWTNPAGTTQYQLQVTPANNDGPGVNLIIGSADDAFDIPAPPDWYGMLPDITYTWRVRATDATVSLSETDSGWGPWSDNWTFRTPKVSSSTLTLSSPAKGATSSSLTPTLTWSNTDSAVFYYEVQVSKDPGFGTNAFLYSELRHGAVTAPLNSYTIPSSFPLEAGTTYYWRVRPRVQGDGRAVDWPAPASFKTPAASALVLDVASPADESTVNTSTVLVTGKTSKGAYVSVDEFLATVDASGNFSVSITLDEGPNVIDIIASDEAGNVIAITRTVTYIP